MVPAQAGTHPATVRNSAGWIPAFAGTATLLVVTACAPTTVSPTPVAAPPPPEAYRCLLPSEQRMLVAELFFGRNIRGRAPLSDAEWEEFARDVVTPNFPDGFTAFDGSGQWRNPATGAIARDPAKILLIAAQRSPDLAARLTAVIDAYKQRFHQQSVGLITRDSCAAF